MVKLHGEIRELVPHYIDPDETGDLIPGRVFAMIFNARPHGPGIASPPARPLYRGYFYGGSYEFDIREGNYEIAFYSRNYLSKWYYDLKISEDTELNAKLRPYYIED